MTKASRDAALNELSAKIFSAMLGEVIMDCAIQTHREVTRSRAVCDICKTRCNRVHVPSSASKLPGPSRAPSPTAGSEAASQSESNVASGSKSDGNANLECVGCQRMIAYNRYAQHLSSCPKFGLGRGRTSIVRNASAKKLDANGRSVSPYVDSSNEAGDDSKPLKGKDKASPSKLSLTNDEEPGGSQKRPASPQITPSSKKKKAKTSASARQSPANLKAGGDISRPPSRNRLGPPSSQPKAPSKLRSTPTISATGSASVALSHSRSPSPGSDSSDDTPIASASTPSSSAHSPTLPSAEAIGKGRKNGKVANGAATAAPAVKRPLPPPARLASPPPVPPVRRAADPDYMMLDDLGQETGSSSDTDSS